MQEPMSRMSSMSRALSSFRIDLVVFLAGLAAVCWIAVGYAASNPLASAVTLLIGACYVAGALELRRYRLATATLVRAVAGLAGPVDRPPALGAWLDQLDASLRGTVRARVEGERAALPAPALTPYLVGLLVLLGMLGTLLGMVATLKGTGAALQGASDLDAVRTTLAAPVKGLGFAFGTSIAGVATSAMLGLLAALCRRERGEAVHLLDAKIATTLRVYSQVYQREQTFKLMQRQAEAMPVLVERLQTMMTALEQQSATAHERQMAGQQAFLGKTEATWASLAASMRQSLKESAAESARAAGAALQPVVEATMAGLSRETSSLHDTVAQAVQRQLDGLASGFESTAANVSEVWNRALAEHQRSGEAFTQHLHASVDRLAGAFEQRSAGMLEGVAARLDATATGLSQAWNEALAHQGEASAKLAAANEQALAAAAAGFEQRGAALVQAMDESHANLQTQLASRDEARLQAWTTSLASMAAALREDWQETGAQTASRQREICETLASTAQAMSAQSEAHARETIGEISRLVAAASEAPKAAAEVVAELRQKLSESMVRDTAMLEERSRILDTLSTLLDAVNHASTRQREAIDALVATSADLLERVGARFTDKVETEAARLDGVAGQVSASAVEVASLSDAFAGAVQVFGASNDRLVAHLERIESALDRSLTRSDEQLAYYVAQAREVIDLSMLSQKQIVEDLQQLAGRQAPAGADAA